MNTLTSQYQDKKFKSKKEFNAWLEKTYHFKIEFENCGQDLMSIYVADEGEIIHCNMQAAFWNGKFVNMPLSYSSGVLYIFDKSQMKWSEMSRLVLKSIHFNAQKCTNKLASEIFKSSHKNPSIHV